MLRRQWLKTALLSTALGVTGYGRAAGIADETWTDRIRERALPLRIRWPMDLAPAPAEGYALVLFSHGLGGTRHGGAVWGEAWSKAGFVIVHLQHPGSDLEAVRNARGAGGLAMTANARELGHRLQDVVFVLDEIDRRRAAAQGRWNEVRAQRVGMSGHSFGAHTTLGMAGQRYPGFEGINEARFASFIALSPSLPPGDAQHAFGKLTRPMLHLTGTRDGDVVGNGATPERRIAAFDALPAGKKAQLVLRDADHMTFAGQTGRALEAFRREAISIDLQARHHEVVAALSTDWWRATLLDDHQARERLKRPASLAERDTWTNG